ncbi:J domain-containing protein [Halopiger aswanensis]|uniref:DnaJ-like protein n=1 Tax=Halopiger aswanensis TaxID=148449 RepID=A0A3R7DCA4_9EURY|nr:J domain-containing protein [Halopiger aswanensis]RKD97898.1 DnaJ-like protein [Halopiger aswanensis]
MAAGETGCDGCGRSIPSEAATTVAMPNGEQVTCCPQCAPHARAVTDATADGEATLDQRRAACDGCRGSFLESELEDVRLPDGTVIACCPSCAAEAPSGGSETTETADGNADGPGDRTDTGTAAEADGGRVDDGGAAPTRCSQCSDPIATEPFRVTTVDGRTERLCRSCKEDAAADGIIKDVEMRASRARDVLGVDPDAGLAEIRDAYHQQVKRAHPDRKSGSRSAFQLVTDAYERLRREASSQ